MENGDSCNLRNYKCNENDVLSNNHLEINSQKCIEHSLYYMNNDCSIKSENQRINNSLNNNNIFHINYGNLIPFCYNKKTGIPIFTIGPHCNI